jgi:hypothetical protein
MTAQPTGARLFGVLLGSLLTTSAIAQAGSPTLDGDPRAARDASGTARAEMARAGRSRAVDERRAVVIAENVMHALIFPALASAATPDELWQAMQFANTQNFRDDIGTIHVISAGGTAFDLENKPAFLAVVTQPVGEIGLSWEHGGRRGLWAQLDDALSQQFRAQVQRIRDAEAGHADAQQAILAARKAFALTHGAVFGHSPREYLTAQEWADYQARQAAAAYRLQHPDIPPMSSP